MRILVGLITLADMVHTDFVRSLIDLRHGEHDVTHRWVTHTITSAARNCAAHAALAEGFDALLFLDTDMTFHPDTLIRLAGHLECSKAMVVSALYRARRGDPGQYFAFTLDPETGLPRTVPEIDMAGPVLAQVDGVATGCLIIRTDVFRALDQHAGKAGRISGQPYFWYDAFCATTAHLEREMHKAAEAGHADIDLMPFKPGFGRGEDLQFCSSCRDAGIPIHIDTRLIAGHLAMRSYGEPQVVEA